LQSIPSSPMSPSPCVLPLKQSVHLSPPEMRWQGFLCGDSTRASLAGPRFLWSLLLRLISLNWLLRLISLNIMLLVRLLAGMGKHGLRD
jgi:hypothetical protein